MKVSTYGYENTHGRRPRGFGTWWFRVFTSGFSKEVSFRGTYSDARREAVFAARTLGCTHVEVLP